MSPFVRSFLTALVNSNFWIALGAASLTASTQLLFGIEDWWLVLFVFFATVPAYYFMRMMKWMSAPQLRSGEMFAWVRAHHKALIRLNFLMTLGAFYSFRHLNFDAKIALLIPAIVVFFYAFPFKGKDIGLRRVYGLKLWLIALSWAWVTVVIPLASADFNFTNEIWWHCFQRVLFIAALGIAFDIRDYHLDEPKMGTVPAVFGIRGAQTAAFLALAFYDLSLLVQFFTSSFLSLPVLIALLLPSELLAFLLYFAIRPQSNLYYSFWMDATLVVWWPLFLAASWF